LPQSAEDRNDWRVVGFDFPQDLLDFPYVARDPIAAIKAFTSSFSQQTDVIAAREPRSAGNWGQTSLAPVSMTPLVSDAMNNSAQSKHYPL